MRIQHALGRRPKKRLWDGVDVGSRLPFAKTYSLNGALMRKAARLIPLRGSVFAGDAG